MKVAFRVDASPRIGTGHLMRCLTLADALKSRGAATHFICRHLPDHLAALLEQHGHPLTRLPENASTDATDKLTHSHWLGASQTQDARDTLQALKGESLDWLVVDHYALDARWESAMRQSARRILAIDDIADRTHDCDLLLDQNLYADMETRYSGKVPDHCRLLLGPRYALLRDEFRRLREHVKPRTGPVRRVLVFFGGMDADNLTGQAIEALHRLDCADIEVDVIIGAQHPACANIEADCRRYGYRCHVQTTRMAELMAGADLAIGAAGSASWERCCLGLPALAVSMADNQRQLIRDAAVQGLLYAPADQSDKASFFERHIYALLENPCLRTCLSKAGMAAVDGLGVERVARELGCHRITVRPAHLDDAATLFAWRNHPSIRAVSRSKDSIDWSDHQDWLAAVLVNPNRLLLIGLHDHDPIGVVRFDIDAGAAEVSIYLVPGEHEPGLGTELLASAEQWLVDNRPDITHIRAEVLGDNRSSHGLFRGGGYQVEATRYIKRVH